MKTIVRVIAILPDSYIRIQRLREMGFFFQLEEEVKTGHEAADFIELLLAKGGRMISTHEFIDEDEMPDENGNFPTKISAKFEYISE